MEVSKAPFVPHHAVHVQRVVMRDIVVIVTAVSPARSTSPALPPLVAGTLPLLGLLARTWPAASWTYFHIRRASIREPKIKFKVVIKDFANQASDCIFHVIFKKNTQWIGMRRVTV